MQTFWRILPVVFLLSACVQIKAADSSAVPDPAGDKPVRGSRQNYRYYVEIASQTVGFSLLVNGVELLSADGGSTFTSQTDINDWMISGNNDIAVTIIWPERTAFAPGVSSASFKLFSNTTVVKEFKWPAPGIQDVSGSYPHTYTDTFKAASGFPKVLLERAERVFSSAGVLPREDQAEIVAITEQFRRAFTEKNMEDIDALLKTKYADLAAARFTTPGAVKTETNLQYRELMEKDGYAIKAFSGRYSYFSTADDRVVRLVQGRIGFPEPALVVTWRDGRAARRWELDLYFAKIDGKWVIIR
jgi:hypothetical protein